MIELGTPVQKLCSTVVLKSVDVKWSSGSNRSLQRGWLWMNDFSDFLLSKTSSFLSFCAVIEYGEKGSSKLGKL